MLLEDREKELLKTDTKIILSIDLTVIEMIVMHFPSSVEAQKCQPTKLYTNAIINCPCCDDICLDDVDQCLLRSGTITDTKNPQFEGYEIRCRDKITH